MHQPGILYRPLRWSRKSSKRLKKSYFLTGTSIVFIYWFARSKFEKPLRNVFCAAVSVPGLYCYSTFCTEVSPCFHILENFKVICLDLLKFR